MSHVGLLIRTMSDVSCRRSHVSCPMSHVPARTVPRSRVGHMTIAARRSALPRPSRPDRITSPASAVAPPLPTATTRAATPGVPPRRHSCHDGAGIALFPPRAQPAAAPRVACPTRRPRRRLATPASRQTASAPRPPPPPCHYQTASARPRIADATSCHSAPRWTSRLQPARGGHATVARLPRAPPPRSRLDAIGSRRPTHVPWTPCRFGPAVASLPARLPRSADLPAVAGPLLRTAILPPPDYSGPGPTVASAPLAPSPYSPPDRLGPPAAQLQPARGCHATVARLPRASPPRSRLDAIGPRRSAHVPCTPGRFGLTVASLSAGLPRPADLPTVAGPLRRTAIPPPPDYSGPGPTVAPRPPHRHQVAWARARSAESC